MLPFIGSIGEGQLSCEQVYLRKCLLLKVPPVNKVVKSLKTTNVLDLKHYGTGTNGVAAIASSLLVENTITDVVLSDNGIRDKAIVTLAPTLITTNTLRRLDLSDNKITSEGAMILFNALRRNVGLRHICLRNNALDDEGEEYYHQSIALLPESNLQRPHFELTPSLQLSPYKIIIKVSKALKPFLELNTYIEEIDLSQNDIGGSTISVLSYSLSSPTSKLKALGLSWCSISDAHAWEIAESLKGNMSLEKLDLSWNIVGLRSISALAESMLTNVTLKSLNISNNKRVGGLSAVLLNSVVRFNRTLKELTLDGCPLGKKGITDIKYSHRYNKVLKLISLKDCCEAEYRQAVELLHENNRLVDPYDVDGHYKLDLSSYYDHCVAMILTHTSQRLQTQWVNCTLCPNGSKVQRVDTDIRSTAIGNKGILEFDFVSQNTLKMNRLDSSILLTIELDISEIAKRNLCRMLILRVDSQLTEYITKLTFNGKRVSRAEAVSILSSEANNVSGIVQFSYSSPLLCCKKDHKFYLGDPVKRLECKSTLEKSVQYPPYAVSSLVHYADVYHLAQHPPKKSTRHLFGSSPQLSSRKSGTSENVPSDPAETDNQIKTYELAQLDSSRKAGDDLTSPSNNKGPSPSKRKMNIVLPEKGILTFTTRHHTTKLIKCEHHVFNLITQDRDAAMKMRERLFSSTSDVVLNEQLDGAERHFFDSAEKLPYKGSLELYVLSLEKV
jgi:hypothetical protein